MKEGRFYLIGSAIAFVGLGALVLLGPSPTAIVLLVLGLATVATGGWLRNRRSQRVHVEVEDEHLHPIPVLDAPKGTFDLIAGMAVRVDNHESEPVGVRIDTLLYERTPWKWDRPVSEARAVALLAPSVVPARTAKSFFVKNYTRIPDDVAELTTSHFVKLLVETSAYGKSVHRVFLRERFELPKESRPTPRLEPAADRAPLLPFSERFEQREQPRPNPPLGARLGALLRKLRPGGSADTVGEFGIHPLRRSEDSLEGLIDEINAELDEDLQSRGG